MTFLILYPLDGEGTYAGIKVEPRAAGVMLSTTRAEHPDAFLAEPLTGRCEKHSIPGELARAIEAWNAMPKEVTVPRLRGNLTRLVAPYRRWKKEAGQRDYLLEQLVADVEATPFCWPWIRFPWLFGKKNGELNSEKLRSGQWKNQAAPGAMTQADYARLADRVAKWRDRTGGGVDGNEESFQRHVGISSAKWRELQAQFNGSAAE